MSISVPGVPMNAVSATMTNGTLTRKGDAWVARPAKVGENATLTVSATIDGRPQTVATSTFRVRKLPDPVAFITYSGSNGAKNATRAVVRSRKHCLRAHRVLMRPSMTTCSTSIFRFSDLRRYFSIRWATPSRKYHRGRPSLNARKTSSNVFREENASIYHAYVRKALTASSVFSARSKLLLIKISLHHA